MAAKVESPDSLKGGFSFPEALRAHHGASLSGPVKDWFKRRQIPPVLLFTGPSGIGKRRVAFELAQWILCEKNGFHPKVPQETATLETPLFGCRSCISCLRIQSGNTVAITEILPEDGEDSSSASGTLKIDQFRELKASVGFNGGHETFRIILIPKADRMTPQAANSVLKLLEEPPVGWLLFLTANDSTLLLPTIVSRCQIFRLKPLAQELIQDLLGEQGVHPEEKRLVCASLAQGSWNRAVRFAQDTVWEKRKLIFQLLNDPQQAVSPLMDWMSQEPVHFEIFLDILEQILGDLIRWAAVVKPVDAEEFGWKQMDHRKELVAHTKTALKKLETIPGVRAFWLEQAERCAKARYDILTSLNKKLLSQDLLFPWLRIQ